MEIYDNLKKGERGAWISIYAYILLSILKLIIGFWGHSEALRADGLNNTTDVIASIAVLIGLRIARKPPDRDHHYGHFRAETIASLVAAFIMFSVGLEVLFTAGKSLFQPSTDSPDLMTAWVSLVCALVMFIVYRYNNTLAKKVKSQSLKAAALDNRSDAFVSLGVFLGIMGSQFHIAWLDTVTAFIVGIIICKTAWEIFKEATHMLTDGFSEELIKELTREIHVIPRVKGVKNIKGRMHGSYSLVDITIYVDPRLNVVESHNITVDIEKVMKEKFNIFHSQIHIEPCFCLKSH